jgi:hypothetical protein
MRSRGVNPSTVLPGAICDWTFGWYTYVAPGEPYADLGRAMRQTKERGFDTLRICAMPSFVARAVESGNDELAIASPGRGVADNLRWYSFRGGARIEPTKWLLSLFREARHHDMRIIISNWDLNQSFKFEAEPLLYDTLRAMTTPEQEFAHIERTLRAVLSLLAEHGLLDVASVVEIHNELEGMEIGPSSQLGRSIDDHDEGPKGTEPGARRLIRSTLKALVERVLDGLRSDFPGPLYSVNTVWPWCEPEPPANQDIYSVNFYLTDSPALAGYLDLFENGDVWQGRIIQHRVQHLLRPGAPTFDDWSAPLGERWRDPYYPQCYLALYAEPDEMSAFFTRVFAQAEAAIKRQATAWLDDLQRLSQTTGRPWYLGEGYASLVSLTSLWDSGEQSRNFHAWIVEQAMQRGACGLTVATTCSPENPDMWKLVDWMRAINKHIVSFRAR